MTAEDFAIELLYKALTAPSAADAQAAQAAKAANDQYIKWVIDTHQTLLHNQDLIISNQGIITNNQTLIISRLDFYHQMYTIFLTASLILGAILLLLVLYNIIKQRRLNKIVKELTASVETLKERGLSVK